jgi:hypothetical protein
MNWFLSAICFLFGHDADQDRQEHYLGDCRRCGQDARPSWMIEMEMYDRLEAMAIRAIEKRRKT